MSSLRLTYGDSGLYQVSSFAYCPESKKYYELSVEESNFKTYTDILVSLTIKPYSFVSKDNFMNRIYDVNAIQRFDITLNNSINFSKLTINRCCYYFVAKNNNENIAHFAKFILDFYYDVKIVQKNVEDVIKDFNLAMSKIESYITKKQEEDSNDK